MSNNRVFGQSMGKKRGGGSSSRYQNQFGGMGTAQSKRDAQKSEEDMLAERRLMRRRQKHQEGEQLDVSFGYERFDHKSIEKSKRGWIFNILPTTISSAESASGDISAGAEQAALELYFRTETGSTFKSTVLYAPYFYAIPDLPHDQEDRALFFEALTSNLMRLYESIGLSQVEVVHKIDLDQVNHLSPTNRHGRPMVKLIFDNVQQLMDVRKRLQEVVRKNQSKAKDMILYNPDQHKEVVDPMSTLIDLREYDVPYVVRVCTDLNIRAGAWYTATPNPHDIGVALSDQDVELKADPVYMAFDIECTKAPLKFPDANVDSIFMISYMVNGQGFLILSRHVVSQDVQDFEYTPKPGYPGPFHIFNEATEEDLLRRFFDEYKRHRPQIVVTYNGDFFDWPFVEQRAALFGLDIWTELGVEKTKDGEYRGRCSVHLDAFHWVQRDSYLPQGSQGLKAVTKYKLGYDPVEVDPEDMLRFAQERPVHMATYSVSDAVATYYLYEKYVHMFIFSLATIIPLGPEDVLRKGSGTLCEVLLMVQACSKSIICPNKQTDPLAKFHDGHLLESETYIGGKVECLETGVYRSDVEYDFDLKPSAFQMLIDNIDRDLTFAIEVELGGDRSKVTNYDEIRSEIVQQLEMLRDRPKRTEKPYIYHLDVGAMYPNIILTNRLQPSAMVDDATCAACDFNQSKNGCKRNMEWVWRGDFNPASKQEYDRTRDQLSRELIDGQPFNMLSDAAQAEAVAGRLKIYSRNAYRKTKVTKEVTRNDTVCMRENDFYVDTVRRFRDRRYELKKLTKVWKKKTESGDAAEKKAAEDRTLVYDSLQVAHKCILNSFYGYVMRKGARWRSMEMAGIVTKTGADLITQARILVEQIGRPLELDTDGIWCILPKSFPDVYKFKLASGGSLRLEYPCVMLNADVHENFTNHQYQTLKDPERGLYETRSECSIFFEVDGPYRCMVLPASTEEGKLLKKRYAVFNFDGSLAELKGFELKRRGELELIKTFQSQVFARFLDGNSLEECYASVADIANHWIDVLDTQGESLETEELVDLISENRSMSRQLEDYGSQKGTSQTTARRLGQFLGAEIIKDKGLNCKFIIAERPYGAPVTERAIPTAIWKAEPAVTKHYLRKWLKAPELESEDFDIRLILDWEYYKDRLGKTIQKIITIPAALQKVENPVPRIPHPDWLHSKVRQLNETFQQVRIDSFFKNVPKFLNEGVNIKDMEDFGGIGQISRRPTVHRVSRRGRLSEPDMMEIDGDTSDKTPNSDHLTESRLSLAKDNFSEWLKQKKSQWRGVRHERKRVRLSSRFGDRSSVPLINDDKATRNVSSMEGYIRDAARALRQSEWHVIEIRELSSSDGSRVASSGEFVLWVMIGSNTLQKIQISVPRIIYITSLKELKPISSDEIMIKRVDKHLPHNKSAAFTYEITMAEHIYKTNKWVDSLIPTKSRDAEGALENIYETSYPLMLRALTELGCVVKTNQNTVDEKPRQSFQLHELQRVAQPGDGIYLNSRLQYKKIFLYHGINQRTKSGVIAVFVFAESHPTESSPNDDEEMEWDDAPEDDGRKRVTLNILSNVWVVKPGSTRGGQKGVTRKQCEKLFSQLLQTIHGLALEAEKSGQTSEYSTVSPLSKCSIESLIFVEDESKACSEASEVMNGRLKGNAGPTILLVNSGKSMRQLRRSIPSLNSFPVIPLPFPPGVAHNPSMSSLPALNWEQPAIQLVMEAYFYMFAVAFPKRLEYSRYGNIPIGNIGDDECTGLYDVSLSRQLVKSRALSWASPTTGKPDLGVRIVGALQDVDQIIAQSDELDLASDDIWGDEGDVLSPVICNPGAYRSVCAEIDVHDLAIAALTDNVDGSVTGPSSPASVAMFGADNSVQKHDNPLGDEMSTSLSLPLLRAVVGSWLRDAFEANSEVADDMLHHIYQLVSSSDSMLCDPSLHRIVHSMMKTTFFRLLGELQRLGCIIVHGSFHKITVATGKSTLGEAEEYIQFVISTIGNKSVENGSGGIEKIALRPSRYYTQVLFLDEHNYGGIELERPSSEDSVVDSNTLVEESADDGSNVIVSASVISGWSIRNYLGSEIAQEYFRAIIARFSKEIFKREQQLRGRKELISMREDLLEYKRKVISKHFATDLSRALDEIIKERGGPAGFPDLPGYQKQSASPPLEFIKAVSAILELDTDVVKEVHTLKRGLLAQIGVPEYSKAAVWKNPCPTFILPDLYCVECHESRDTNLCEFPPLDGEVAPRRHWACQDCGTLYNPEIIERRLIEIVEKRVLRFQVQDLRCSKTNRVSTRMLSKHSNSSAELNLDISQKEAVDQLHVLHQIAQHHQLEWLEETTESILNTFQDE